MDRLEEHEIGYLEGIVARYGWADHDYYSNADVSVDADDVKTLEKAIELIKAIPSAEPKTGHWIEEDMFDGDVAYRCSECNELFWIESGTPKDNGYNFCPKCGKRLVEPQESEDKPQEISDRNLKMWHDIYEEEKRRKERSEDAT